MRFIILLSIAFLATTLSAQSAVTGAVTDKATGAGVPEAKVRFYSAETGAHETVTDQAGRFSLPGLAPDSYYISAEKDGYFPPSDATEPGRRLPMIRIADGGKDPIDFQLQRYGSIRGRVINEEGKPVPGAQVTLPSPQPLRDAVISGDDGGFVFPKLVPGAYTILARPKADNELRATGRLADVPTYYPGVTNPSMLRR